jgi:ELWxxDGT repeat protein
LDGTPPGTWRISQDLCLNSGAEFQAKLYFSARQKIGNPALWETDGSADGTHPVPLSGGYSPTTIDWLTAASNGLFVLISSSQGYQLFRLAAGGSSAEYVSSFYNINGVYVYIREVVSFDSQVALIFNAYAQEVNGSANQVWISDGSEAGTRRIQAGFTQPSNLMVSGGNLYFSANDLANAMQLWRTDGTDAGTIQESHYPQSRCMTWLEDSSIIAFTPGTFILALNDTQSNPPGSGCGLWLYDAFPQKTFLPSIYRK